VAVTLAPLLHEGTRRVYPATALLFAEGDPPGPTLVVAAGTVRIATESGGEIAVVGPGELVGEFSAVDGLPRSASVTAVTDVEVRAIAPVRFAELLEANPEIDRYVRRLLDERRHVSLIARGPVGQGVPVDRLAQWILVAADGADDDWLGGSLDDMAAGLDASRELLSRAIDHLVRRGAVDLDRGRLLIRSREILAQLADAPG
jgi:CRP/FNR family transcriptional regulator, cyclic AMP receptor protein